MTLAEENAELRKAIEDHRAQRLDDRCWMDDQALYAVLKDGNLGDNSVPPEDKMLENCRRYIARRCNAGNWKSYQELEAALELIAGYARTVRTDRRKTDDGETMCLQTLSWCEGLLEIANTGKLSPIP